MQLADLEKCSRHICAESTVIPANSLCSPLFERLYLESVVGISAACKYWFL
jgi:hypothetical protein